MNKICVYTAITGNYDSLKSIKFVDSNIDYICFTNNKNLKSDFWTIKYIDEELDNLLLARKIKILSHEYLKDYDLTIWMDGAIEVLQPISKFLSECCNLKKYDMIGFKHQVRDCIYDEIDACVNFSKETIDNAKKLESFLLKESYPRHNGLIESTVLVRKNNKSVNQLMGKWFEMLSKYSKRDQLSFNYVLWKNPIKIDFLDMYVFDNPYFKHDLHKGEEKSKKYRLYLGDSSNFDFHKCIDGTYTNESIRKGIKVKLTCDTDKIELQFNEEGSLVKSISLNVKNEMLMLNVCDVDNKKFFYDNSRVLFQGNFKKDSEIILKIDIEENSYIDNLRRLYIINQERIGLKDGLDNQIKYTNDLQNIIDDLNLEKNSLLEEIRKNSKQISSLNDQNTKLIEQVSNQNNQILDLNKQNTQLLEEINGLNLEISNLSNEISNMINSKSWKVTKPLRTITNKLKNRGN